MNNQNHNQEGDCYTIAWIPVIIKTADLHLPLMTLRPQAPQPLLVQTMPHDDPPASLPEDTDAMPVDEEQASHEQKEVVNHVSMDKEEIQNELGVTDLEQAKNT